MNAAKKKKLRRTLEARRAELRDEVDGMAAELRTIGSAQEEEKGGLGNHLAEDGSSVMEAERISTISGDLSEILAQVNSALERLDDRTFGTCQRCQKPINEERLEALPHVAYCIECQSELEREHALRTGR